VADERVEMIYPTMSSQTRVIMLEAMTQAFCIGARRKRGSCPGLSSWCGNGSLGRGLATLDDDLFMVGESQKPGTKFFIMCKVAKLVTVVETVMRHRDRFARPVRYPIPKAVTSICSPSANT
jgi:hypothetical protein